MEQEPASGDEVFLRFPMKVLSFSSLTVNGIPCHTETEPDKYIPVYDSYAAAKEDFPDDEIMTVRQKPPLG